MRYKLFKNGPSRFVSRVEFKEGAGRNTDQRAGNLVIGRNSFAPGAGSIGEIVDLCCEELEYLGSDRCEVAATGHR